MTEAIARMLPGRKVYRLEDFLREHAPDAVSSILASFTATTIGGVGDGESAVDDDDVVGTTAAAVELPEKLRRMILSHVLPEDLRRIVVSPLETCGIVTTGGGGGGGGIDDGDENHLPENPYARDRRRRSRARRPLCRESVPSIVDGAVHDLVQRREALRCRRNHLRKRPRKRVRGDGDGGVSERRGGKKRRRRSFEHGEQDFDDDDDFDGANALTGNGGGRSPKDSAAK